MLIYNTLFLSLYQSAELIVYWYILDDVMDTEFLNKMISREQQLKLIFELHLISGHSKWGTPIIAIIREEKGRKETENSRL